MIITMTLRQRPQPLKRRDQQQEQQQCLQLQKRQLHHKGLLQVEEMEVEGMELEVALIKELVAEEGEQPQLGLVQVTSVSVITKSPQLIFKVLLFQFPLKSSN